LAVARTLAAVLVKVPVKVVPLEEMPLVVLVATTLVRATLVAMLAAMLVVMLAATPVAALEATTLFSYFKPTSRQAPTQSANLILPLVKQTLPRMHHFSL
jgi:hypothetical protein